MWLRRVSSRPSWDCLRGSREWGLVCCKGRKAGFGWGEVGGLLRARVGFLRILTTSSASISLMRGGVCLEDGGVHVVHFYCSCTKV